MEKKDKINKCWVFIILILFINIIASVIVLYTFIDKDETTNTGVVIAIITSIWGVSILIAGGYITGHNYFKNKFKDKNNIDVANK